MGALFRKWIQRQKIPECMCFFMLIRPWKAMLLYAMSLQLYPTLCTLWTVACQAPLSMWFSRQEYWSGLPCPLPGDLSDPGIELTSPALADRFFATSTTWEALMGNNFFLSIVNAQYYKTYRCKIQWFTIFKGYTPFIIIKFPAIQCILVAYFIHKNL